MTDNQYSVIGLTPAAITTLPKAMAPFVRLPPPERPEKASHFLFRGYPRAGVRSVLDHMGHRWWRATLWATPTKTIVYQTIEWDQTHKEAMGRARELLKVLYMPEEADTQDAPFLEPLTYHY